MTLRPRAPFDDAPPAILFEDGEALVVNKPAGLPLERPRAGGPALADHFAALRLGFARDPVPVHRLDTDTSGCLLLARNPKALPRFARAFEDRLVGKVYYGVLAGVPAQASGTVELALAKISSAEAGWRMIPARKGKPASTSWSVVAEAGGLALVRFVPETGRTHQIRVHAASGIGVPLLGDPVYGRSDRRSARTMLHAGALYVPRTGKPPVLAVAPLPVSFAALGFELPASENPASHAQPIDRPRD